MTIGTEDRHRGSRILHHVDGFAARPSSASVILVLDGLWLLSSLLFSFPTRLETICQTVATALTLALVFVLQHTQARQENVTQRKLDELLRALPAADQSVIALEEGSDPELGSAHERHRELRRIAVRGTNQP